MSTMKPLSPLPKLFDLDFYLKNILFRKQSVGAPRRRRVVLPLNRRIFTFPLTLLHHCLIF